MASTLRWSVKTSIFLIFCFFISVKERTQQRLQCRNWFDKFRSRDFSGRSNEVGDDQIKAIIESDIYVTVREIEEILKIPKSTIDRHIQHLGLVKKLDIWIPHEFKEFNPTKRINACDLHLKRNKFYPFLT